MVAMVKVALPIVELIVGSLLRHQDVVLLRCVPLPVGNILALSLSVLTHTHIREKTHRPLFPEPKQTITVHR